MFINDLININSVYILSAIMISSYFLYLFNSEGEN